MTVEMTQQTIDFCIWLNHKLKLHANHPSNVWKYLDKKYSSNYISVFDIVEFKEFLIECKKNEVNKDFK